MSNDMWEMLNLSASHQGPPGQHGPHGPQGPIGGEVSVFVFSFLSINLLCSRVQVQDSRLALIRDCCPSTAET